MEELMKNWNNIKKVTVRVSGGAIHEFDTLIETLNRFRIDTYCIHTNSFVDTAPWSYINNKHYMFYDELGMVIDPEFIRWTYDHFVTTYYRWKTNYRGSKRFRWRKSKSGYKSYRYMNVNRAVEALEYDEELDEYRHMIKDRTYVKLPDPWAYDQYRRTEKNWKSQRKTQWKERAGPVQCE
jgi:hypothetical protein